VTRCIAPALIANSLSFAAETAANLVFDYADEMGEQEHAQILRALSDHIVACEVIASTLRKDTVV